MCFQQVNYDWLKVKRSTRLVSAHYLKFRYILSLTKDQSNKFMRILVYILYYEIMM